MTIICNPIPPSAAHKPPQRLELRRCRGRQIRLARRLAAAEPAQQVGAHRRQQVVAVEPAAGCSASIRSSARAGPSTIDTAAAWLSSITGDGLIRSSTS